jgi:starch-binding outer membrane protein, SusD/RagB family
MKRTFNIFRNRATAITLTAILWGSSILMYSCKDDFLSVPAAGQLSDAQLSSKAGVEGLLVGAYSVLLGRGIGDFYAGSSNWVGGSVQGGESNKGTDAADQAQANPVQRYEILSSSNIPNFKWKGCYEGIARCNATLRSLAKSIPDITADDKKRMSGEARFLRGHYYFELQKTFNKVPYIDENTAEPQKVANSGAVWAQIEADLKFAYENLPETQGALGRANKWAAGIYLGKAQLFQKKYADALTLFNAAIANGKTTGGAKYKLADKFNDAFNVETENNSEHVFSVQAAVNTGTVNNAQPDFVLNFTYTSPAVGCCGFFQPSIEMGNSYRTDATGLPIADYNAAGKSVKNDQGVAAADVTYTTDAGNLDPRIDHTMGRRGIPYLDWGKHPGTGWVRDQADAGPYSPKKFMISKAQFSAFTDGSSWTRGYTALNYPVIRFADVLLMAAECEVETGGAAGLTKALDYVNLIRTRAANPAGFVMDGAAPAATYKIANYTAFADQPAARAAVRFERKLELSQEGHRFYDLNRWGVSATELNAYLTYESNILKARFGGATFKAGKSEYWPIPQAQIDLQPGVLTQNPGY